jgi:hypothetical protein
VGLVVRYPGLAADVETQVTLLLDAVLPDAEGAIATEAQLDALAFRGHARGGGERSDAARPGGGGWGCVAAGAGRGGTRRGRDWRRG